MQLSTLDVSSHPYVYGLLLFLAGLLGPRGVAWVQLALERRKRKADAALSDAQTRHSDVDSIVALVEQLRSTNQMMLDQSKELMALRADNELLKSERAARLLLEAELDAIKTKAKQDAGMTGNV